MIRREWFRLDEKNRVQNEGVGFRKVEIRRVQDRRE